MALINPPYKSSPIGGESQLKIKLTVLELVELDGADVLKVDSTSHELVPTIAAPLPEPLASVRVQLPSLNSVRSLQNTS
jgi:hypothetical protein